MKLMIDVGIKAKPIAITKTKKIEFAMVSRSLYFYKTGYALVVIVNSNSVSFDAVFNIDSYIN